MLALFYFIIDYFNTQHSETPWVLEQWNLLNLKYETEFRKKSALSNLTISHTHAIARRH